MSSLNLYSGMPVVESHGAARPVQRTAKGLMYDAYRRNIAALADDPSKHADWIAANADLICTKSTPAEVRVNEVLATLSVMYANDEFIGDQLMPVIMTGGALSGTFFSYPKRERFAYPDDDMSDRADANELNSSRTTDTYSLTIRALQEVVDQMTIQNQSAPLNELMDATQAVLEGLAFQREKRQATVLTTAGNYSGNTTAIAAADRWDSAGGGDPLGVIDTALAAMWRGRGPGMNVGFCSLDVWNVVKRHPQILDAVKYGGSPERPAMASLRAVADLMELDAILVGKSREDTANTGQTASYSRIWSDVFGIVRVMRAPSTRNAAFGVTFQDALTTSEQSWMPWRGAKGAFQCKSAHSDQAKVIAGDSGYLVTTPIG